MANHVGDIIKQRREVVGMSKATLAKRLGCSPQNIDSLEHRKSIDFELAQKISIILEFDLFSYYRVFGPNKEDLELSIADTRNLSRKYIELLERYNELLEMCSAYKSTKPVGATPKTPPEENSKAM
jgi:transcriptional regulator with XRE-family HTH domain